LFGVNLREDCSSLAHDVPLGGSLPIDPHHYDEYVSKADHEGTEDGVAHVELSRNSKSRCKDSKVERCSSHKTSANFGGVEHKSRKSGKGSDVSPSFHESDWPAIASCSEAPSEEKRSDDDSRSQRQPRSSWASVAAKQIPEAASTPSGSRRRAETLGYSYGPDSLINLVYSLPDSVQLQIMYDMINEDQNSFEVLTENENLDNLDDENVVSPLHRPVLNTMPESTQAASGDDESGAQQRWVEKAALALGVTPSEYISDQIRVYEQLKKPRNLERRPGLVNLLTQLGSHKTGSGMHSPKDKARIVDCVEIREDSLAILYKPLKVWQCWYFS